MTLTPGIRVDAITTKENPMFNILPIASIASISIPFLPLVGEDLDGGTFAGIITQPDGTHVAVVLLPAWSEGLTWKLAGAWAEKQGGVLPSRPVAALLYANCKAKLQPRWHWTSEAYDASFAWGCDFYGGGQSGNLKSAEGCAVAVRCIHLTA